MTKKKEAGATPRQFEAAFKALIQQAIAHNSANKPKSAKKKGQV